MIQYLIDHKIYDDVKEWFIPYDDLKAVYKKMSANVNALEVANCGLIFFAESWLIENSGQGGSEVLNERSSFLSNNVVDFYIGGLDDMAAMTTYYWQTIEQKLKNPVKPDFS